MICERCKKNQATVHMTQIINGKKTEQHLCSQCAAEINAGITFEDFFSGFFDNNIHTNNSIGVKKCPVCSMTYDNFLKNGKFGCAQCYETFRDALNDTFKSIHSSCEHQGKYPNKLGNKIIVKKQKEELKRKLVEAIAKEDFEAAAALRDEIKGLESEE